MPRVHCLALRAYQRLFTFHGEDGGVPIRFDNDPGQPDIGKSGVGGTTGNRPLRRAPRRAEQRTAERRRDEVIDAWALRPLRRACLLRRWSGRRDRLNTGIVGFQLAKEQGADSALPARKRTATRSIIASRRPAHRCGGNHRPRSPHRAASSAPERSVVARREIAHCSRPAAERRSRWRRAA